MKIDKSDSVVIVRAVSPPFDMFVVRSHEERWERRLIFLFRRSPTSLTRFHAWPTPTPKPKPHSDSQEVEVVQGKNVGERTGLGHDMRSRRSRTY